MSWVLEALISRRTHGWPEPITRVGRPVPLHALDGERLHLLPLTDALRSALGIDESDPPVLGFPRLHQPVADLATAASRIAPVAYVHAEYFGGTGFQAAVCWHGGTVAFGPRFTCNHPADAEDERYEVIHGWRTTGAPLAGAIDEALQFLGVEAVGNLDEIDIVGLGACRRTEDWSGEPGGVRS